MSRRQSLHRKVVIKEGFLTKAPAGKLSALKSWERRWFVFGTQGAYPYFECYTDPQAVFTGPALERIELTGCQQIITKMITVDARHPHSFNLILSDRMLCLATDTRNEMAAWCKTLQKKLEELGCLSAAHENVYEEHRQLSRLRQVVLQEDPLETSRTEAGGAEQPAATAVTRRPRAATPVSLDADDAPAAAPATASRSMLVENDFAPRLRTTAIDSEAKVNFGRLLAVCGQDGSGGSGCEAGNCSCSGCSNSTTVSACDAAQAPAEVAARPASSSVHPAAMPRHTGAVSKLSASAAAAGSTGHVTNLSLVSSTSGLATRSGDATPVSSFRPIEAAPPIADESAPQRLAQPVARPLALNGTVAAVARASLPYADRKPPAADETAVRAVVQPPQQPPVPRARTERPAQPHRSECDFFVRRTQAARDDPAEPTTGTCPPAVVTSAQPMQRPSLQLPAVTSSVPPLSAAVAATLPSGLQDTDDESEDDGGEYETLVGGACAREAGVRRLHNGSAPTLDPDRERLLGQEQRARDVVMNEYELPPVERDRQRPSSPVHGPPSSSLAAAEEAGAMHAVKPPADSGPHNEDGFAPPKHRGSVSRQQPQAAMLSVTSADRAAPALETGMDERAADYVNWARAEPKAESRGSSKPMAAMQCRAAMEATSEPEVDDDDEADIYDDALAYQLSDSRAVAVADRTFGFDIAATSLIAHGHDSYSEAMATTSPAGEGDSSDRGAAAAPPPSLPASTAVYARLARVPKQQEQQQQQLVSSKPVTGGAEAARHSAGAPPRVAVSGRGMAVDANEYLDWTGSIVEAAPSLPHRLNAVPSGRVTSRQTREDHVASVPNGRSSSSSSGDDVPPRLPARAAVPPRAAPKPGGTLVFGGAMLKMPRSGLSSMTYSETGGAQPIRQSQVDELLSEINNAGGVKVSAYKKEVAGNICFVDVDGRVWVAGWNQKNQPLLQKLLHVGDEVLALNHEPVTSCTALSKSIRMGDNDRKLSFVLRRLPLATVLSIRRRYDGEDVGIRCQTGTPEVDVVVPGGLAHSSGLRPRANTGDSMRQCNWFLTEINSRPVNLFFKNGEVEPRLSAVGKDVTLVLQPADFVNKLKKQLKSHWGYKSYVVQ